ncbi:hypothetical protein CR513_19113, partial [Mucuna pruriens]
MPPKLRFNLRGFMYKSRFGDRTFHRLLRSLRSSEVVNSCAIASDLANIVNFGSYFDSNPANITPDLEIDCDFDIVNSDFGLDNMANIDTTLKELVTPDRLESKIIELTFLIKQLAIGQHHISPPVRVCGICAFVEYSTDVYPTLQEIEPQRYQPPPSFKQQQPMQPMAMNNIQFQENVFATSQNLQTQVGQLATTMNQLQSKGFGQIPCQTILSPQVNMSDITLRSGKELQQQQLVNLPYEFFEFSNFDDFTDCDCNYIGLIECPIYAKISNAINIDARVVDIIGGNVARVLHIVGGNVAGVVEVVAVQPPLASIV